MNATLTTNSCPCCHDIKWIYGGSECSTGYYPCPACQPPRPPLPEWVMPMGYDERINGETEELTEQ
jgi:hypothetical protein